MVLVVRLEVRQHLAGEFVVAHAHGVLHGLREGHHQGLRQGFLSGTGIQQQIEIEHITRLGLVARNKGLELLAESSLWQVVLHQNRRQSVSP